MVTRWQFYDPTVSETITVPINPASGGSPSFKKGITRRATTAPGEEGRTIIFEGLDEPQDFKVEGSVLTQEHYELLEDWVRRRHQIQITDDLGRVFWVYLTELTWDRQRTRRTHPYYHKYTMSGTILDWPS